MIKCAASVVGSGAYFFKPFLPYSFSLPKDMGVFFWGSFFLSFGGEVDLFLTNPSHYWGYVQLFCLLYDGEDLLLCVTWFLALCKSFIPS